MEELDLKKLFTMFWTRKIQIIVIVIVFALVGAIYTLGFTMPVYSARTTLLLATQQVSTENSGTMNTDVTLNTKLVSTYSELIKSNDVLREVKQNLHSDVSENQLKKNIKVSSVKDTSIIEITVLNESASVAADIAKALGVPLENMLGVDPMPSGEEQLLLYFRALSDEGQEKLIERAAEMVYIYGKKNKKTSRREVL